MSNYLKTFSILSCLLAFVCSCSSMHQLTALPSATLNQGNFKYVKYVEEQETATYLLGMGGLSPQSLQTNAYNEMVKKANLGPNQTVANVSIRQLNGYYLGALIMTRTIVASCWVIEFAPLNDSFSESFPASEPTPDSAPSTEPAEQKSVSSNEEDTPAADLVIILDDTNIAKYSQSSNLSTNYKSACSALETINGQIEESTNKSRKYAEKNINSLKSWVDAVDMSIISRSSVKNRINNAEKKCKSANE